MLSPIDNNTVGKEAFATKRPIFKTSSVSMNHDIADESFWGRIQILKRTDNLKNMAVKIFKML